jgi:enoyl-CoA hydratase/carnithine racemase
VFATEGSIAYLTFNRPEARNAMTWSMYDALARACDAVESDPAVRVFVLRAAGDAFVAGTDIRQFTAFASADDGLEYEARMESVIGRLERLSVPTIAQVQGVAAGGGCILALVCDLRVCTPAARFGVPIARTLGNCLSAANHARLMDLIGPGRTKDLLMTGPGRSTRQTSRSAASRGMTAFHAEPLDPIPAIRTSGGPSPSRT